MNSKMISIFSITFTIIATSFAIMRINGSRDADLPAFGVLIMAMIMVQMLNSRVMALETTLKELKEGIGSAKSNSDNAKS